MSADHPHSPDGSSLAERVANRLNTRRAAPVEHPEPALAEPPSKTVTAREQPISVVPTVSEPPVAPVVPEVIRTEHAATSASGRAPLQINFQRLQAAGFITPSSPPTGNTEAIRVIKRQLLKVAFPQGTRSVTGGNDNVIMITSSMPGEGKTFISLNLAMSFSAERDLFVLLIDADCHRRSMGELLGAKADVGLVDILADSSLQVGDLIQRTNIPNLSFLPGGRPYPHSAEMLASKQFGVLMQDIAARYPDRVIIIDTPPVLASTEAAVLSGQVGQTLVVVEKDRTSKRQLQRTLEMLEGGRNVGCILNMVPQEETFTEYGYY
ncbi:polysaccharide biosynthesis tyrosine autokinase [Telmatospirillum sp.]|uniref:polysaccharide biosynthesis tyrosine autokinase n=1 Tax=Telmatospirillum sp. TaxID=2079197 RepID=UPI00284F650B|nr:polysaccharide biosynthesis tyrosine autokinase [Telmatospirillum sp.]MDR3439950.1 polysaccharide biosynthesis tyrosine autokinase [Telmatospirillum sp.]